MYLEEMLQKILNFSFQVHTALGPSIIIRYSFSTNFDLLKIIKMQIRFTN